MKRDEEIHPVTRTSLVFFIEFICRLSWTNWLQILRVLDEIIRYPDNLTAQQLQIYKEVLLPFLTLTFKTTIIWLCIRADIRCAKTWAPSWWLAWKLRFGRGCWAAALSLTKFVTLTCLSPTAWRCGCWFLCLLTCPSPTILPRKIPNYYYNTKTLVRWAPESSNLHNAAICGKMIMQCNSLRIVAATPSRWTSRSWTFPSPFPETIAGEEQCWRSCGCWTTVCLALADRSRILSLERRPTDQVSPFFN